MTLEAFLAVFLLINLAYAAPTGNGNDTTLPEELVVYRAEFDIVQIVFPLNALNRLNYRAKPTSRTHKYDKKVDSPIIFFVLADTSDEQIVYKGVYVRKNGNVTKLLHNGRDVTASNDDSNTVYIAASDGIYYYNTVENKAEKYGNITDNLLNICKFNGSDILYILTKDHIVYKVTEKGTKKEKLTEIDNPQHIAMDYNNYLYYSSNNDIYVYGPDGINKILGLPKKFNHVRFFRTPITLNNCVPVVLDEEPYLICSNMTIVHGTKPLGMTAVSCENPFLQYYGYNKKMYELNVILLILDSLMDKLKAKNQD